MSNKKHDSFYYDSEEIIGSDSNDDDHDLDPDWRKTPIFKRLQKLKVPHVFIVHVSLLSDHIFPVQFEVLTAMLLMIHVFSDRHFVIGWVICDIHKKYSAFIFESQGVLVYVINGVNVLHKKRTHISRVYLCCSCKL